MQLLLLWFILRVVSSIFAAIISVIRPITPIEKAIPLFPPALPLSQWLDRALLSPWLRWDAVWFEKIVSNGYKSTEGAAQFHPFYVWLTMPLVNIGIPATAGLLFISSLAGITLLFIFLKLARVDLPSKDGFFGLLLFIFSPPAFIFFAPYSEALFILFAALCLYWTCQKKWWLAGLAGGLAVLTRQQGVFLLFPMLIELWENDKRNLKIAISNWMNWLATTLIPLAIISWLTYRAMILNDIHPDFTNINSFIYTILISPQAMQVVNVQQFIWPWQAIFISVQKIFAQPDVDIWVNIILGISFLILMGIAWQKMRLGYKVYCLVIAFVSFSYYTGPIHPYMGLPRHLLLAFPVFIGAASMFNTSWKRLTIIAISLGGWFLSLALYGLQAWIP